MTNKINKLVEIILIYWEKTKASGTSRTLLFLLIFRGRSSSCSVRDRIAKGPKDRPAGIERDAGTNRASRATTSVELLSICALYRQTHRGKLEILTRTHRYTKTCPLLHPFHRKLHSSIIFTSRINNQANSQSGP